MDIKKKEKNRHRFKTCKGAETGSKWKVNSLSLQLSLLPKTAIVTLLQNTCVCINAMRIFTIHPSAGFSGTVPRGHIQHTLLRVRRGPYIKFHDLVHLFPTQGHLGV